MDELEFRKQVYANPRELEQEVLDAARANPVYQEILDETLSFEDSLDGAVMSSEIPEGLEQQLLAIAESQESSAESNESEVREKATVHAIRDRGQSHFQKYAIAASLTLAVGIGFSLFSTSGPSAADVAFGEEMLEHLHHDNEEIDDITGGEIYAALDLNEINSTMANAGTRLASHDETEHFAVRSAKPCEILPAFQSAHLVLAGTEGAVSVIIINNSPVDVEFNISDERFDGMVLPMEQGNIILVGEHDEDLAQYASLFSESVEWAI